MGRSAPVDVSLPYFASLASAEGTNDEDESVLTISPEKVCFIIIKAKEFDAKDEVTEPDPGSNPFG